MDKAAKARARQTSALERMNDNEIDLCDIPEITDWIEAVVGKFYGRSRKRSPFVWTPTSWHG